jgi:predicted PurR-regulated permease PerM
MAKKKQIHNNIIRQCALLGLILGLSVLLFVQLKDFLPALLGAFTLYIMCRKYNFHLIEVRQWKPWRSALMIVLLSLLILALPLYFIIDILIEKVGHYDEYSLHIKNIIGQIHQYVLGKINIDLLSPEYMDKLQNFLTQNISHAVSTVMGAFSSVLISFFILYFMLSKPREFEGMCLKIMPLKYSNTRTLSDKVRKMVVANALGIPIIALGQGLVATVGYAIFGAENLPLLCVFTCLAAMVPLVGGAIVYVPLSIYLMANGQPNAYWLIVWGAVVVSSVDNLFRFTFLRKLEDIHPLNTVFGILVGLKLFGFMGLIFGPILISMLGLLMKIYRNEFLIKAKKPQSENPNPESSLEINP